MLKRKINLEYDMQFTVKSDWFKWFKNHIALYKNEFANMKYMKWQLKILSNNGITLL